MPPSMPRALLGIMLPAIFTVTLAHTTQRRAPPGAQPHTEPTVLDLGAAVLQDMSAVTPPERALPGWPPNSPAGTGTREVQAAPPVAEPRHAGLPTRMEAAGAPPPLMVGAASSHASGMLAQLDDRRAYQPVWSGTNGPLPRVDILIDALCAAEREGLRPPGYHLAPHVSSDPGIPRIPSEWRLGTANAYPG
jgi:Scaffold domain